MSRVFRLHYGKGSIGFDIDEVDGEFQESILRTRELVVPQSVSHDTLILIDRYLRNKSTRHLTDLGFQHKIMIFQAAEQMEMPKLLQLCVQQLIPVTIDDESSISLLQLTHKRLAYNTQYLAGGGSGNTSEQASKQENNLSVSGQCWYSLLNLSINYISSHFFGIYQRSPERLLRIKSKVLTQILERTCRNIKDYQSPEAHLLFKALMQAKRVTSAPQLCLRLKESLHSRRINTKVHAKLSWKLENLAKLEHKATKLFKFVDYDWFLDAVRSNTGNLEIGLNFQPEQNKPKQSVVGVFYFKVLTNVSLTSNQDPIEQQVMAQPTQTAINIIYMSLWSRQKVTVLSFSPQYCQQLNQVKMSLNIYCSFDQVYSFVDNYITHNAAKAIRDLKGMDKTELAALVQLENSIGRDNYLQRAVKLDAQSVIASNTVQPRATSSLAHRAEDIKNRIVFTEGSPYEVRKSQKQRDRSVKQEVKYKGSMLEDSRDDSRQSNNTSNVSSRQQSQASDYTLKNKLEQLSMVSPSSSVSSSFTLSKQQGLIKPPSIPFSNTHNRIFSQNSEPGNHPSNLQRQIGYTKNEPTKPYQVLRRPSELSSHLSPGYTNPYANTMPSKDGNSPSALFTNSSVGGENLIKSLNMQDSGLEQEILRVTDLANYLRPGAASWWQKVRIV